MIITSNSLYILLRIQPRDPSEGIDEVAANDSIENSISQNRENEDIEYLIENTDDGFIFDPVESIESVTSNSLEPETQLKTITVQQYRNLMQLMVEVEKQKETIQKLECLVRKKDSELEVLKEKESNNVLQFKKSNNNNSTHISTFITLLNIQDFLVRIKLK